MSRARAAFTFVEVLAILLVAGTGLIAVLALVQNGVTTAGKVQSKSIGLVTAVSVANDPQPLLAQDSLADWTYVPYAMDNAGTLTSTATGWVNGLYVQRTETTTDADVLARDPASGTVYVRAADVTVDVFEAKSGTPVTSFTTRIVRQRGMPTP